MFSIDFYTVILFDQYGNTFQTVASELSDQIHVHSFFASDGTPFRFESELYHLRQACENHGITCYIHPAIVTVDLF